MTQTSGSDNNSYFFIQTKLAWNTSHSLRAVVLGGSRLQKDRGGVSIDVGGAPLYAPPLHPQLFADFFDLGLQQAFLSF